MVSKRRRQKTPKRPDNVQRNRAQGASPSVQHQVDSPTRAAVARRLGRSIGAVRFQEGKTLHPWQDGEGVWRFDPAEVDALASKIQASAKIDTQAIEPSRGKLAANACQLFREGKTVVDVVIALEQPFEVVQPLYWDFLESSRGMHVPASIVERMALICEVDELTPEIVLQSLEENSRQLDKLSGARHGGRLARTDPGDPRR
jgi:hypothetical protein